MRRVFVDTGGFVALLVAEDQMHVRANALFESAARDRWMLVTTNVVLVETYSVLLARARNGRGAAIALLRAHSDKGYSLCDALSFDVMERLGISEAIASTGISGSMGASLS